MLYEIPLGPSAGAGVATSDPFAWQMVAMLSNVITMLMQQQQQQSTPQPEPHNSRKQDLDDCAEAVTSRLLQALRPDSEAVVAEPRDVEMKPQTPGSPSAGDAHSPEKEVDVDEE